MLELDSIIKYIHANLNDAARDLWFKDLSVIELTDTDNGLINFAKLIIIEEAFGICDTSKNLLHDSALSHHLNAEVYYFAGEEYKEIFDDAKKTHDINLTHDTDCIAFRLDEVDYIFVYYEKLANKKSAQEVCKAIQHDLLHYKLDEGIIYINAYGEFGAFGEYGELYQKSMTFLISQLYLYFYEKILVGDD